MAEPRRPEAAARPPAEARDRAGTARRRPRQAAAGQRADPVRRAACDVLLAVDDRGAYANLLLPSLLRERGLTGRDAALATELAYGALRGQGRYDAVLAVCSDRDIDRVDPPLRAALRLGAHQLLATRVRPHAAVATSVDVAKDLAGRGAAGFVNAVLRRVATRDLPSWLDVVAPSRSGDPVGCLAVRHSHPRWIVAAVAEALGEDVAGDLAETEAALAADSARPRVALSVTPGLADVAELVTEGGAPARWSPFGAYLGGGDPAEIPAVAAGRAGVQDEASQLAALALARVDVSGRDERWLDMCAGPGGKGRLLGGLAAQRGARLLASDARPRRARLLRRATATLAEVGVVVADATAPPWRAGLFDRVLADVPCSGLGALRRRPEARWRKTPEDVDRLGSLQRDLLASALDSARPGGVVAYVTCSPHAAETRQVVADTLAGRGDVHVLDAPAALPEVPGLRCPGEDGAYAQFWPHRHGSDAIFVALLRRAAGA